MNETRKELINILSEHMDKTLSEGCLVETRHNWDMNYPNEWFIISNKYNYELIFYSHWQKVVVSRKEFNDVYLYKILGHYDITAVLKYVESKSILFDVWKFPPWEKEIEILVFLTKEDEVVRLPFKPLHLYTEKQEKDLLELLKKIK